ncbi:alpha/beta fold hydrolase [Flindersiella endophytica]
MVDEVLTTGSGEPVTVFAPGRGQSIAQTRPFGSGVRGTRVFFQYGDSSPPVALRSVADQAGATRAFGASLGVAAIAGVLADEPGRFERLVFAIPAGLGVSYDVLGKVSVPVLVLGQRGDDVHPVRVAEQAVAALPQATLRILPPGGLLVAHRAEVRQLVTSFLNEG